MFFELTHSWWALAVRGIAALIFGLIAVATPGITLLALIVTFAIYAIIDGIFALVAALASRSVTPESGIRWWALLVEGILGILAGVTAFVVPGVTALFLLYLIALWAIVTGIFEVVTAAHLRKEISGEWLMALSGVASLVFGILLVIFPETGALAVVWGIGVYAIIFGVLLLALSFRLRGHGREIAPVS